MLPRLEIEEAMRQSEIVLVGRALAMSHASEIRAGWQAMLDEGAVSGDDWRRRGRAPAATPQIITAHGGSYRTVTRATPVEPSHGD